ncbi:8692_t:CDS:2 [Cetraspora pellucida]|uniref:8692_t:CDS:1 n=1 Tax=Cetraspora pellucida TaxID=1433469 RepID=A0A9N9B7D8_9GLOM|nr:8692_t:CDS:2 [Cetraspora pellucida]
MKHGYNLYIAKLKDDQLFSLMLGEFPVNFADGSGFVIEPPHSLFNNYTTQEFSAIRSNAIKINNEAQLSTLLRFHVEQHKLKRLEFYEAIKNEYGDAEKKIKPRHNELKLLKLYHQLIKVSQYRQYERLKKVHAFILGKVEATQSSSPVTSINDNPFCMRSINEKGNLQNSTDELIPEITDDQNNDATMSNTLIKNNNDSIQSDILPKQFVAFKVNQKKFTAKKDILSMECFSGKQTAQSSPLSNSLQSNQLEVKDKIDPKDDPSPSPDKCRSPNYDDHKYIPSSSYSASWESRSKYSYSYIPRSKAIMERNSDYSIHNFRRSIKPRPYRKLRPYDNRHHRTFPPFHSEIKNFNPSYSQNRVWKNDYTSSKFSDRYSRDKDFTSTADSSSQHDDRFSSSSFIHNSPEHDSTLFESSHQTANNPNLTSIPKSRSTDSESMDLSNSQRDTTPTDVPTSSTLTNHSTVSNNNFDKKQFPLDMFSCIPSEVESLLDDKMSLNDDNRDNGLNTIHKDSMENKFTKYMHYDDNQYNHGYKQRNYNIDFNDYRKYKYDTKPIDDYRLHKPGNFIYTRRHGYFPRDKYKNMGNRFYDEHNRRFDNKDHPIHHYENYQRDVEYQRSPRYHQRNMEYLRDDKHLRNDNYMNFSNSEKRINIQHGYPSSRNDRHDSHHMASDIKGNFEINRYHSQTYRVHNPSNKYFHNPKPYYNYNYRGYQNPRMKYKPYNDHSSFKRRDDYGSGRGSVITP